MADDEKAVPVGIRLAPKVKRALDLEASERGIYIYQLLGEIIDDYFARDRPEEKLAGNLSPYLRKLAEVLAGGEPQAIEAVTRLIDYFHAHLPAADGTTPR